MNKIYGLGVNEKLENDGRNFGEIGDMLGIISIDGNELAIFKRPNGSCFYKETVIDTDVSMRNEGPYVHEVIYMGNGIREFSPESSGLIMNKYITTHSLQAFGDGEINVDLALEQNANRVLIVDGKFLEYLRENKKAHPELPLTYALVINPYQNTKVI